MTIELRAVDAQNVRHAYGLTGGMHGFSSAISIMFHHERKEDLIYDFVGEAASLSGREAQ